MHHVYVIQNTTGRYYIGSAKDGDKRLREHNANIVRSTKHKGPWKLTLKEQFETKYQALHRERQIKRYKGGEAFKRLVSNKRPHRPGA